MGIAALFSPVRIRRNETACIDCAKCAKACPSHLPVDRLVQIRSAECIGCYECVAICPAENALAMQVHKTRVRPWMVAASLAVLFFGVTGYAKLSGHWDSPVPSQVYRELIPNTDRFDHPR